MKATVLVRPKEGILDPQGEAVLGDEARHLAQRIRVDQRRGTRVRILNEGLQPIQNSALRGQHPNLARIGRRRDHEQLQNGLRVPLLASGFASPS